MDEKGFKVNQCRSVENHPLKASFNVGYIDVFIGDFFMFLF